MRSTDASLLPTARAAPVADAQETSTWERMRADSLLPDDIRPDRSLEPAREDGPILLTGATGFLGGYLLRSLLRRTAAPVHCLVRPRKLADPIERIRRNLERYGLWDPSFTGRIHPVPGNLLQSRLGLDEGRFDALSRETAAIYHGAATVNWVLPYEDLRRGNVLGTTELLRLASRHRPKPFHFVSSMGVCYATEGPRLVTERDDMFAYRRGIHLGYAQSKCVAEKLVRRAGQRGLPIQIYRPALISADTVSGRTGSRDFLSTVIQGCVHMGSAPDLDWALDCCPVDYVADAIVGLSRLDAPRRVHHLANAKTRHLRELVLWLNLYGYRIRLRAYADWLEQLRSEATGPDHPFFALRRFFLSKPVGAGGLTLPELYEEPRRSRVCARRTRRAVAGLALHCPELNGNLLDRYTAASIQDGLLPGVENAAVRSRPDGEFVLDAAFFQRLLRRTFADESLEVQRVTRLAMNSDQSILSELTSWRQGTTAGLSRYRLRLAGQPGMEPRLLEVVVKAKAEDTQVLEVGRAVATLCGSKLGAAFARHQRHTGVGGCHLRELALYQQTDERFRQHTPAVLGTVRDDERRRWLIVLENLTDLECQEAVDDIRGWQRTQIEAALRGLAALQAVWFGRESELRNQAWLGPVCSTAGMAEARELWRTLAEHLAGLFPEVCDSPVRRLQEEFIERIDEWWPALEQSPRTLIHNDFNPRNLALRRTSEGLRLCAFDWELATLGAPVHDLAEFLCFAIPPTADSAEVCHYLEVHRQALAAATGQALDPKVWQVGFGAALKDLLVNRLALYGLMHRLRRQPYLRRVLETWRTLYGIARRLPKT